MRTVSWMPAPTITEKQKNSSEERIYEKTMAQNREMKTFVCVFVVQHQQHMVKLLDTIFFSFWVCWLYSASLHRVVYIENNVKLMTTKKKTCRNNDENNGKVEINTHKKIEHENENLSPDDLVAGTTAPNNSVRQHQCQPMCSCMIKWNLMCVLHWKLFQIVHNLERKRRKFFFSMEVWAKLSVHMFRSVACRFSLEFLHVIYVDTVGGWKIVCIFCYRKALKRMKRKLQITHR